MGRLKRLLRTTGACQVEDNYRGATKVAKLPPCRPYIAPSVNSLSELPTYVVLVQSTQHMGTSGLQSVSRSVEFCSVSLLGPQPQEIKRRKAGLEIARFPR